MEVMVRRMILSRKGQESVWPGWNIESKWVGSKWDREDKELKDFIQRWTKASTPICPDRSHD